MLICILCPVLLGGPVDHSFSMPTYDRWNYGFNASAGTRSVGSTFSAFGSGYPFDDRDGQVLLGFVTGDSIDVLLPSSSYRVTQCTIEIALASDDIPYDSSTDAWGTYDPDGPGDDDAGRPTSLTGIGFRNGWTGWSFGENGPFGDAMASGVRNCFPTDFDQDGNPRDISNNLTQAFDPNVWATGTVENISEGSLIPAYSTFTFEVDVNDVDVQCYLRRALADGLLEFMVTSLHPASEPGSGGVANYPDWVLKENPLIDLGVTSPASLRLAVELQVPSGVPGDVTGDGLVNVEDLLGVLEAFGRCPCCAADLDGSGVVDVNDLLDVISAW
jgi:hypothetical protein